MAIKFKLPEKVVEEEHPEAELTLKIDDDGCASISANGIIICRLWDGGYIHPYLNNPIDARKLKAMGFVIDGNDQVKVRL